ncbi:MAG: 1,4-dihydroxy-2-naphthoyl-CoA synthase, partial [Actinobacteria bacterium]|nr:1,4-dihydroxy-2-naphthoyl-CoA synthase [Actinomycetota bacterium]
MNPFQPELWEPVEGFELSDITYHRAKHVPA